ncbi:unnamed protein product [Lactuca saligna]|uniref:Uncharacterized protein n=1 Tax=Lactuca saligna TaxID=75948 RepID=A0AA35Y568_LACSI|nr:unnamed protein product [Lactuca saligna]
MDHHYPLEEVRVDLESVNLVINPNEDKELPPVSESVFTKLGVDPLTVNVGSPENSFVVLMDGKLAGGKAAGDFTGKEKRKKSTSAKKPPKPPRQHSSFSLDSADQKLIKELTELAMIKRARIERMKALMQKKASKASSSSNPSLFAMLFTIIFFLVLLLQGMSCQKSHGTFKGSPQMSQSLISIKGQLNPSAYAHDSI